MVIKSGSKKSKVKIETVLKSDSDKSKDETDIVLSTLGGYNGMGKLLYPLIVMGEEMKGSSDAVVAFLLFLHERQSIWD